MFKELFIAIPTPIVVTDNKGIIMIMNEKAEKLFGSNSFSLNGVSFSDFLIQSIPDANEKFSLKQLKLFSKKKIKFSFRVNNGSEFYAVLKHKKRIINQEKFYIWVLKKTQEKPNLANQLKERIKEQLSILNVSEVLFNTPGKNAALTDCLPAVKNGWQFPEAAGVRIKMESGEIFATENFKETQWMLSSAIESTHEHFGTLEVCYLYRVSPLEASVFLFEEERLIEIIARIIGLFMQQWSAIKKVEASETLLKKITNQVPANTYQFEILEDGRLNIFFHSKGNEENNFDDNLEEILKIENQGELLVEEDRIRFFDVMKEAYRKISHINVQYRIYVNGEVRWRWMRAVPNKENGKVLWYGASQDVTELFEYISIVEQILFDISHVIRKPVANILGLATLMNEKDISKSELLNVSEKMELAAVELDKYIHKLNVAYNEKSHKSDTLELDVKPLIDKRKNIFLSDEDSLKKE